MERHLHIVCAEMPWPADCGDNIDIQNRLDAFHQNGVLIHLHYFGEEPEKVPRKLKNKCTSVSVYPEKNKGIYLSGKTPAVIHARIDEQLIETLNADNYPILMEGISVTGNLTGIRSENRKICIRVHREGSAYYNRLKKICSNPVKKLYYAAESYLMKKYVKSLPGDCMYACVSRIDARRLSDLGLPDVRFIPAFPSWQTVTAPVGMGNLCLFHGNLSAPENERTALWLLWNIFNKVRIPFVIAGKNPSRRLQKAASFLQHTCLISNPCDQEMNDLIRKAHINILPCLHPKNPTGIRQKLLHALFEGRHCVATASMVAGTDLEDACHIGNSANGMASIISQLYYLPFAEEEITLRKRLLCDRYNNEKNLTVFTGYLW